MHDPLDVHDLVSDELRQRGETGHDVTQLSGRLADTGKHDRQGLENLLAELADLPRTGAWDYEEPDALPDILDSMPSPPRPAVIPAPGPELHDRILGGWLGRIAGCNLGKPIESGDYWTSDRIRSYLELTGSYPLRDYVPAMDPMPEGYRLEENWVNTTRGRVAGSDRDDDIDYTILALHMLERHGMHLTPADVAATWLAYVPYLRVFTAERAAYVNLLTNVPIGEVATTRNPYREWIGALIRGDAHGWTQPGRPEQAILSAYNDATLSHRANGIYGEMWSAALMSSAAAASTVAEAFERSLHFVPARSRLAEALHRVRNLHRSGATWDEALSTIQHHYGHYSWVHTVNNAAIITAGLLWGDGDYTTTVGLTVQGGWDTDSNGATAGAVAGTVLGAAALPEHFVGPLQDRTRSAVFGYDNSRISDLAHRTITLATANATA
ncbi:ADP-ribosylglycohydrolase family protein [Arthrobacter burdickii]|uniref:ADP-ribosylglycohydrolase family protein n=1 Tax=Arthrobacter burdickii TaxID=3035920 RepID=A0ABT8K0D5_9MICC|nr:ADP-ribosylglycohydrolase family protein [Arthrobacter burdickii]MDN4610037.1 ADP-ribosylglycohydrolase family protein [Arthrobacter burdickii]